MPRKTLIDIAGELKGETEKAYRFFDGKTTPQLAKPWMKNGGTRF